RMNAATQATSALVLLDDVSMTYRGAISALGRVSLTVREGEFVSLVGPSGCGKSTLLRLVAGLVSPTQGRATVAGAMPRDARRQVRFSFVFQDATLLPWRSAERNVTLPLELAGVSRAARREKARSTLGLVGLGDFAGRRPSQLSGGMRMRVSLARALVTDPQIILLDEPFGALDDMTRQALNEELLVLWQRRSWTALFVTHNIAEAAFLSTRIVVLSPRPGTIVADVPVPFGRQRGSELRSEPEFARFVGQVASLLQRGTA
ncbi:MAG TPA: ABC transporter ATP-binding protein, partial [Pirellulales bacterium]|nr:ABC transporter ATP-binding protein [Pirellulales bacterium]